MIPKEITAFYNRYKQRLYNIALRITGDSFDAEEIVQDTVIKYLRTNPVKLSEEQTGAWLSKACVRASIDMMRLRRGLKLKLEKFIEEDSEEDCSMQWDSFLQDREPDGTVALIRQKLSQMPDGYRTVLSLILFEGYDYAEVSQILGVEESTVRSQYLRGKRKLLSMIENKN
ncbi:MAG TPA: sigma-70 family RNA polymerase sigma factor [Candidatus Coprenecus stercoravium]|uniref:Sigma-70 family RNA polymerase sigma factor n=1 Tax=Candidatus Coprenecus stercoravium TaxID=2840735 RepID=A0A9D2GPJ4_9BACT|nr:sigma-70 family RNA polymerase sigma factor [Candidatus Coprenecus stercoravium]